MTYLIFGALTFVAVWFYIWVTPSRRLRKYANQVPGPKPWPIFGNCLVFMNVKSILQTILGACDAYGPVTRVWIGKHLLFVLTDPSDIEIFLSGSKFLEKSLPYRIFDTWFGDKGLLTSNGKIWQQHRKLLTSSFHFSILERSVDSMQRNAFKLCEYLTDKLDGGEFDIFQHVERCGVDIISETAMGINFEKLILNNNHFYRDTYETLTGNYDTLVERMTQLGGPESKIESLNYNYYLEAVYKLRTIGMKRFFQPWLHPEWLFRWTVDGYKYHTSLRAVQTCITSIIQERKRLLEEEMGKSEKSESDEHEKSGSKSLLDFLLMERNFTDKEIENEIQTFMFGGSVTTPTSISFCLHLLSKHPDVQEKIMQEIETLLTENDHNKLTYSDYMKMRYLENVIKESLRMYSPVPLIARTVTEDIKLSSGHVLPTGSVAAICLLHVHRNEKYFPGADKFIPERFENKDDKRSTYAYIPFSAGPRNCIGQKYAMLEMKIVISTLIQKYRFLPSQNMDCLNLESGFVLISLDKHPVRICLRTATESSIP